MILFLIGKVFTGILANARISAYNFRCQSITLAICTAQDYYSLLAPFPSAAHDFHFLSSHIYKTQICCGSTKLYGYEMPYQLWKEIKIIRKVWLNLVEIFNKGSLTFNKTLL